MSESSTNVSNQLPGRLVESYVRLSKAPEIWQSTLTDALRHISQTSNKALGVQRTSIWSVKQDLSEMECLCLYRSDNNNFEQGLVLQASAYPRYFSALNNNRVVNACDARSDTRTKEFTENYLKPLDIYSMLDATIRREGNVIGVICFESVGGNRLWSQEEEVFASSLAELISQLLLLHTLKDRESRLRALFDNTVDSIFILQGAIISECNPASLKMFRCQREDLIGKTPDVLSPATQADGNDSTSLAMAKIQHALEGNQFTFIWTHQRFDGDCFEAEVTLNRILIDGEYCVMGTVRDISDRRKAELALLESQKQLQYRATHDSLTNLPNRESFHQKASQAMLDAYANQKMVAVFLLDLNRFKEVNDTLGHHIGDELLQKLSRRFSKFLDPNQSELFRLGGDEFIILHRDFDSREQVAKLADELNQCVKEPVKVNAMPLEINASIGISLFPEHGENSHALLRCADVAMYYSKSQGEAKAFYDPADDRHSTQRLLMLADLNTAMREDHLYLHFQPRINLKYNVCTGCEALLRWQHPTHGMVPPDEFIPLAEMTEIIHPLSLWVFRSALSQVKKWRGMGHDIPVAVNLSARNLVDQEFPRQIQNLLKEFEVPANLLEIEITESALISDPNRALQVLADFNKMGIHLAIDDFGTGYSSLSYLKKLPIHTLKIDRSFVMDMLTDEADAAIVRSTIGLAHSFGLTLVAEGVENEETLIKLNKLDCEQAQGYHISRPVQAEEFIQWFINYLK
ncbi:MAG: EAL domain-containing protein [Pseudomonadales bacterium]|nr:EAL domain-containing protein [Pseudomonadales bacterium]